MTARFERELCQVCGEPIDGEAHTDDKGQVHADCCVWCNPDLDVGGWVDTPPRRITIRTEGDLL